MHVQTRHVCVQIVSHIHVPRIVCSIPTPIGRYQHDHNVVDGAGVGRRRRRSGGGGGNSQAINALQMAMVDDS